MKVFGVRPLVGVLLILVVVTITACRPRGALGPAQRDVVALDGSSTVFPISEAVAEEFRLRHPKVRVTIGISGTGGGFKKFVAGEIDICNASRMIRDVERQTCIERGIEFVALEVAYDGIAVVVHPQNDWAHSLSVAQLRELWRPESAVERWSDLDPSWPNEPIRLYGPGTDSGTFDYFTEAIVGETKASRSDFTASEDDNVLVRGIEADRFSLGYFGFAYYQENRQSLKLLSVDGGNGPVTPSFDTIRDGSYAPLSRSLFLYVNKAALVRRDLVEFLRFYLENADALVAEVGFVAVTDEARQNNLNALATALADEHRALIGSPPAAKGAVPATAAVSGTARPGDARRNGALQNDSTLGDYTHREPTLGGRMPWFAEPPVGANRSGPGLSPPRE